MVDDKDNLASVNRTILEQLVKELDQSYFLVGRKLVEKRKTLTEKIRELIKRQEEYKKCRILTAEEKKALIKEIIGEILGYSPIDELMMDDAITEIMINGVNKIYIEKGGKKSLTNVRIKDPLQLNRLIQKLLLPSGRKVDESTPFVDAALEDKTRINVVIPPASLEGPIITIRKFSKNIVRIEDLVRFGTLSEQAGQFLIGCVQAKVNIIFSGPTGVGKTTTLGVLSYYIFPDERIVVIEDTAELTFYQEHVVRLQVRLPNIEGKGEITIRDLLRNSLRMRPDRIIIGEVRSGEALDMLQAMASGHSGALGVVHAASPRDVISRLEAMIATSGVNIPIWTIKKHIANNLNLIIQQERLKDGSRKISNITELRGIEGDEIILEDIFTFVQEGFDKQGTVLGRMKATGVVPLFLAQLEKREIKLDSQIFVKET